MRRILLATAAICLSPAMAQAQDVVHYVVGQGGEGNSLDVTRDGDSLSISYQQTENGRGPRLEEELTLDANGLPILWTSQGTTTFGSKVDESFAVQGDKVIWNSQAESGEQATAGPQLYIINDGSPYANAIYAQALLEDEDRTLPALPYGELKLVELDKAEAKVDKRKVKLTRYRIDGIDVTPTYVVLDGKNELVSSGGAVREGYAEAVKALPELSEMEEMRAAQKQLAHKWDGPVEIRNVRVFEPETETLSAPSTVTSFNGIITGVRPYDAADPVPEGNHAIDGAGGTLLPGLHDMHSHMRPRSGLFYMAAGVTSVRDQGNQPDRMAEMQDMIASGEIAGPHIVPNLFLEGVSPYSSHAGLLPETLEEAFKDLRWAADHGYFQLKVYNSIKPEWVKPLADEAHRLGLGVTGHVPAFVTPDEAITYGYDDIAHVNQLMLGWVLEPGEDTRTTLRLTAMQRLAGLDLDSEEVKHTIKLMQEHNVGLDTTAVILERLMLSRAGKVQPGDVPYLDHMPVAYRRYRRRSFVPVTSEKQDAEWHEAYANVLKMIGMLHENGIQLLPGTDDASGFTVLREMELYTQAGISNADALRLGTLGADAYMNREADFGSIKRGKASDFFLVPGNPLEDISAIRSISMVMRGDAVYYPSEIYAYLGIKPFQAPPEPYASAE